MYFPSSGEKSCILNGIKNNLRIDGRSLLDIREIWMSLRTLNQANGSCILQTPDSSIKIYCGIKLELGQPENETPDEGIINVSIESIHRTTFVETAHKLNHEESKNLHEEMKILLNDFLIKNIDKKQLIVVNQKVCWIANVDVFILGMMDASFLDLISLTIRGAFEDLEIPKLQVNLNKITDEYEIDLVNGYSTNVIKFDTKEFPIICTVGEVDNNYILDLSLEEYHSLESKYVMAIKNGKVILGITKMGSGEMDPINVLKIINLGFQYFYIANSDLFKYFEKETI